MTVLRFLLFVAICFPFLSFHTLNSPTHFSIQYIQKYKNLAIVEMERSGVPASIKLAQGLLESQYGTSSLAQKAKNHFGIKCKSYWRGSTYYQIDDDRNYNGQLIESCFRAYENVFDSYVDHSNFLKQTPHYQLLFQLPKTDHIQWAKGLKSCGYATDPDYDNKLIKKIEEFQLSVLDSMTIRDIK